MEGVISLDNNLPTSSDLTDSEICENVVQANSSAGASYKEVDDVKEVAIANIVAKIQWTDGVQAMHELRIYLEEIKADVL